MVDRATAVFSRLIAEQKAAGVVGGDHFAKPGANDRVWGALDKFALRDPAAFAAYYDNDTLALICRPGWAPATRSPPRSTWSTRAARRRSPHRDYHLGFMSQEQAQRYPAHVHGYPPALGYS